ncbi:MAG TPA: NADPH:quinone reductase [Chloroflexota bacterium]|nr:NADPH:quinone reductase [Chloroflexota bacterium]
MRAAWYERKGPAREVLQLGELPPPTPGPGEVRVRVHFSGVNPSDTKNRSGWQGNLAMPFPRIIPHQDGAGVIDAVGEGVPATRAGERVWVYEAQLGRPFGTAAEYVVVPSEQAVPLPPGVDLAVGACLGVPAMTAHYCVFADGPVAGQTVLVTGGAGAVGCYAVQWAKLGGARVLATVSSEEKAAVARAAGADAVLNYRAEDVAARVLELTGGAGVDRVVEVAFGANLSVTQAVLKPNGVVAAYSSDAEPQPRLPFRAFLQKNAVIRTVLVYVMPRAAHAAAVRDITTALEAGRLQHLIGRRLPLAGIAAAHEAVEQGAVLGKVLVEIG